MEHQLDGTILIHNGHHQPASFPSPQGTGSAGVAVNLEMLQVEAAATALARLWQEHELVGEPVIFQGPRHSFHRHHVLSLLDKAVERLKHRKRAKFGQIERWERLKAPSYAHGIAQTALAGPLLRANLLREASILDRHTVFGPVTGWFPLRLLKWLVSPLCYAGTRP